MGSFNGEPFLQRFVTLAIPSHFEMREGLGKSETKANEKIIRIMCSKICAKILESKLKKGLSATT